ncbi:hypothetical protein V8G54_036767, partial [Vigna mungo]
MQCLNKKQLTNENIVPSAPLAQPSSTTAGTQNSHPQPTREPKTARKDPQCKKINNAQRKNPKRNIKNTRNSHNSNSDSNLKPQNHRTDKTLNRRIQNPKFTILETLTPMLQKKNLRSNLQKRKQK